MAANPRAPSELGSCSLRELRAQCTALRVPTEGLLEKDDFIQALQARAVRNDKAQASAAYDCSRESTRCAADVDREAGMARAASDHGDDDDNKQARRLINYNGDGEEGDEVTTETTNKPKTKTQTMTTKMRCH